MIYAWFIIKKAITNYIISMINPRYRIYCSFTVGYFYMNDLYMVHYEKDSRQLFKVTGNMENEIKSKLK